MPNIEPTAESCMPESARTWDVVVLNLPKIPLAWARFGRVRARFSLNLPEPAQVQGIAAEFHEIGGEGGVISCNFMKFHFSCNCGPRRQSTPFTFTVSPHTNTAQHVAGVRTWPHAPAVYASRRSASCRASSARPHSRRRRRARAPPRPTLQPGELRCHVPHALACAIAVSWPWCL